MPNHVPVFPEPPQDANGVIISPQLLKLILDEIVRQSKLAVSPPLLLSDGAEGRTIKMLPIRATGSGSLPLGQYQGQFYGMVSDNQAGFQDIFMIQGP